MKNFFFLLLAFGLVACDEADRLNGESNGPTGPGGGGGGTGVELSAVNIVKYALGSDRISFRYENVYPVGTTVVAEIGGVVVKTDIAGSAIEVTGLNPNTSYTIYVYAKNGVYQSPKVYRTLNTTLFFGGSPNAGKIVTITLNGDNVTISNPGTLKSVHGTDINPTNVEGYNQGDFNGYLENEDGFQYFQTGVTVTRKFNGFNLYVVQGLEMVFVNLSGMKLAVVINGVTTMYDATNFPYELALTWYAKK